MDGWMDCWMDGWMGGWMDCWMAQTSNYDESCHQTLNIDTEVNEKWKLLKR